MLYAYGLRVAFEPDEAVSDVLVRSPDTDREALEGAWSGTRPQRARIERQVDGRRLTVERGAAGDMRIDWGDDDGVWLLDRERGEIRGWAPRVPPEPAWFRVLLDTVLAVVSLTRGFELLHAGAVLLNGGAVAIAAEQGGGKTSLVAALMERGHPLIADDVVALERRELDLLAHPAPPLLNLAADRPFGPSAERLGHVLGRLDDEDWIAVRRHEARPHPLRAVVLLQRVPGAPLVLERIAPPPGLLLAHMLDSGAQPTRQRAKFEVVADIASRVPVMRLSAPLDAPPAALSDLLLSAL